MVETFAFKNNPFLMRDRVSTRPQGSVTVTLFSSTTTHCRLTETAARRVKHLLDAKRVIYEEVFLDLQPERRAAMESISGVTDLPQLFVGGQYVATGWQPVQDMEDDGALDILLKGAPRQDDPADLTSSRVRGAGGTKKKASNTTTPTHDRARAVASVSHGCSSRSRQVRTPLRQAATSPIEPLRERPVNSNQRHDSMVSHHHCVAGAGEQKHTNSACENININGAAAHVRSCGANRLGSVDSPSSDSHGEGTSSIFRFDGAGTSAVDEAGRNGSGSCLPAGSVLAENKNEDGDARKRAFAALGRQHMDTDASAIGSSNRSATATSGVSTPGAGTSTSHAHAENCRLRRHVRLFTSRLLGQHRRSSDTAGKLAQLQAECATAGTEAVQGAKHDRMLRALLAHKHVPFQQLYVEDAYDAVMADGVCGACSTSVGSVSAARLFGVLAGASGLPLGDTAEESTSLLKLPQLLIGGVYHGSPDALRRLDADGKLQGLLEPPECCVCSCSGNGCDQSSAAASAKKQRLNDGTAKATSVVTPGPAAASASLASSGGAVDSPLTIASLRCEGNDNAQCAESSAISTLGSVEAEPTSATATLEDYYAILIQSAWRRVSARKMLEVRACQVYDMLYDEHHQSCYYYNNMTCESVWLKPKCLGSQELELCVDTDA